MTKQEEKAMTISLILQNCSEEDLRALAVRQLSRDIGEEERVKIARQKGLQKEIDKNPQYHFTKLYKMAVREVLEDLSVYERSFLFTILSFINRESNLIVDERGIPMDTNRLITLCKTSKTKFIEVTKRLTELGIITPEHQGKYTYYRVNENYAECKRKSSDN
jgi:DNA-binding transcriptional ArsR family regulator